MRRYVCVFIVTSLVCSNVLSENCSTPLGSFSECVSLYECPDLLRAFETRPLTSSVVSFLRQSECGTEGYTPRVCCGPLAGYVITTMATKEPPKADHKTPRPNWRQNHGEDSQPAPNGKCGIETHGDKIHGGQFTDLDEFPWLALLGYISKRGFLLIFRCGGVLINPRYVLTAAHCVTGTIEREVGLLSQVRLGDYDTETEEDCVDNVCADRYQEYNILRAYTHPGYLTKNKSKRDDIGLVRMVDRAVYNNYVQPICLADHSDRTVEGNDVIVAGWGRSAKGGDRNLKLKQRLPVFNKNKCARKYRPLGIILGVNQLCAGGTFAQDACRGDSGGPLMQKRPDGVWEIVGILSLEYGCNRDGWPAVYSSVDGYIDWIKSTLNSSNPT